MNSILIGSSQPKVLAAFYEKVFGKPSEMPEQEDGENDEWFGWLVGDSFLSVGPHSEINGMSKEPQRIIINFATEEVQEEFDRIKMLGATAVKEPYRMGEAWIATLADPDGNYFQLMTPYDGEEGVD